ncbi:GPW/gp25 family protein [Dyella subtropica]|uniref:GPW/gp25 family protein n=1 Tax=Dyella subtropica TaxID=2992127 RepID=UPI002252F523|nr:GPW/gp25 family protein [Dyella subtropica]
MPFLLERLQHAHASLADHVAAQIQRLVECRPYIAPGGVHVCDFGMPAIVDLGTGLHDQERYGAALTKAIAQYEPRLRDLRLEWLPSGRTLVVTGRLQQEAENHSFRFELPMQGAAA